MAYQLMINAVGLLSIITFLAGISVDGASIKPRTIPSVDRTARLQRRNASKALFPRSPQEGQKTAANEPVGLGLELGKEAGKEGGKGAGKGAGKEAGLELGKEAGKEAGLDLGKEAGKLADLDFGKEAGKLADLDPGKEAGKLAGLDLGKEAGKLAGLEAGKEAGKLDVLDLGKEAGKLAELELGKEAGKEADLDLGKEGGKRGKGKRGKGGKGSGRKVIKDAIFTLKSAIKNVDNNVLVLQNPASTSEQVKAAAEEALKSEEAEDFPREALASVSRDPNAAQGSLAIVRDKGPLVVGALQQIAKNPDDKAKVQEELTKVVLNRLQLVPANRDLIAGTKRRSGGSRGDRQLATQLAISPSQQATGSQINDPGAKKAVEEAQKSLASQTKIVDEQVAIIQNQASQPAQIEEAAKKALAQEAAEDFPRQVLASAATDAATAMQALGAVRDHGPNQVVAGFQLIARNSSDAAQVKRGIDAVIEGRKFVVPANLKLIELSGGAPATNDANQANNAANNQANNANNRQANQADNKKQNAGDNKQANQDNNKKENLADNVNKQTNTDNATNKDNTANAANTQANGAENKQAKEVDPNQNSVVNINQANTPDANNENKADPNQQAKGVEIKTENPVENKQASTPEIKQENAVDTKPVTEVVDLSQKNAAENQPTNTPDATKENTADAKPKEAVDGKQAVAVNAVDIATAAPANGDQNQKGAEGENKNEVAIQVDVTTQENTNSALQESTPSATQASDPATSEARSLVGLKSTQPISESKSLADAKSAQANKEIKSTGAELESFGDIDLIQTNESKNAAGKVNNELKNAKGKDAEAAKKQVGNVLKTITNLLSSFLG